MCVVFKKNRLSNKQERQEMNFLKKMLVKALYILPLNFILMQIVEMYEEYAIKTQTKVDDYICNLIKTILSEIEFSASGIKINNNITDLFKHFKIEDLIKWILDKLVEMSESTETDIDNEIVEIMISILEANGVVSYTKK